METAPQVWVSAPQDLDQSSFSFSWFEQLSQRKKSQPAVAIATQAQKGGVMVADVPGVDEGQQQSCS